PPSVQYVQNGCDREASALPKFPKMPYNFFQTQRSGGLKREEKKTLGNACVVASKEVADR
ncbi:MAG: hypothetical protein KGJ89_03630, partial [Patescibacteria group bacterium]|nr:hypothetical protein [Patescibacteria group bacterium]